MYHLAGCLFFLDCLHVSTQPANKDSFYIFPHVQTASHPFPPPPQHKLQLPWNAGSGDDAFSLAPLRSLRLLQACRRTLGSMAYPWAPNSIAQDSFKRVSSCFNPFIAVYFEWLHCLSKAMLWLVPFIVAHELNNCFNDPAADDYDNKFTVVLGVLFMLWSVLVSNDIERIGRKGIGHARASLRLPPLTCSRSLAAVCVTMVFCYIGCKINEARVVYVAYSRQDFERDSGGTSALGLSASRFYRFLVQV